MNVGEADALQQLPEGLRPSMPCLGEVGILLGLCCAIVGPLGMANQEDEGALMVLGLQLERNNEKEDGKVGD
jgi:hypothetical protein